MVSAQASAVVAVASDSRGMSDGPACPTLPGMHDDVRSRPAVLRHDPFKALAVPRPIG